MTARMYYDADADLSALDGQTVAVIGYGSQGHAHALNLRDSGLDVIVAESVPATKAKAEAAGLRVTSASEAAKALLKAGARRVHLAVLAKSDPPRAFVPRHGLADAFGGERPCAENTWYARLDIAGGCWSEFTLGPVYEGPPGHVHGGLVAAMFDELLGFAQLSGGFTGTLTIRYVPGEALVELKSLRDYLTSFRQRQILQEEVVNELLDEIVSSAAPRFCEVEGYFNVRGGIETRVRARRGENPLDD